MASIRKPDQNFVQKMTIPKPDSPVFGCSLYLDKLVYRPVTGLKIPDGKFFSHEQTSFQTHNFLKSNYKEAFFMEFLVTSKLGMSL
jgi:hypothetical protein